jgi:hypothetical protein
MESDPSATCLLIARRNRPGGQGQPLQPKSPNVRLPAGRANKLECAGADDLIWVWMAGNVDD